MDLKEQIDKALRKVPELKDAKIELETTVTGKVCGFIVSDSFDGMSQTSRQDIVWDQLEKELAPYLHAKVLSLLTLTFGEDE